MAKKYLIIWNSGWGEGEEVIEAEGLKEATDAAYEAAKQEFEDNASYEAKEFTKEVAEEHGLEDELEPDEPAPTE